MEMEIPLGGRAKDLNSRKSRETLVNGYFEADKSGEFKRIKRAPGLSPYTTLGSGPIRGALEAGGSYYVVSGEEFYLLRRSPAGEIQTVLVGNVAGVNGPVRLAVIGTDDPQIMVLSSGNGFVYKTSDESFTQVTDANFDPGNSIASLNQHFWFNKLDSNEFFGSDLLDGLTYDPLFFASDETNPDPLVYVASMNTGLWTMGSRSCGRWQTTSQEFPLRPVLGGNIERGVGAVFSVVRFQDNIIWLADDFTIRGIMGGQYTRDPLSDLSFNQEVKDYISPEKAEAFFVDHPVHKIYYITFPDEDVTWGYDLSTGIWHKRKSYGMGRWRASTATKVFDRILIGDYESGDIYTLDDNVYNENSNYQEFIIQTPPISAEDSNLFVSHVELDCEVGVGGISNAIPSLGITLDKPIDPRIRVERSLDGGKTFKEFPDISLGRIGETEPKVIHRHPFYIRRKKNAVFRFTVTDDVPMSIYGLWADVERGA